MSLFYNFTYKKNIVKLKKKWKSQKIIIFFLKRINNIHTNFFPNKKVNVAFNLKNFQDLISTENLYNTYLESKKNSSLFVSSNSFNLKKSTIKIILKGINKKNFKYSKIQVKKTFKQFDKLKIEWIIIQNLAIKTVKKTLYNYIQPIFEGLWTWITQNGILKKYYIYEIKFYNSNYGFRAGWPVHGIFKKMNEWNKTFIWILNYCIQMKFDLINWNRFKNIFLADINNNYIWKEIEKMLNYRILSMNDKEKWKNDILEQLLFNIYFYKFDQFIYKLSGIEYKYMNKLSLFTFLSFYLSKNAFLKKIRFTLDKKEILYDLKMNRDIKKPYIVSFRYIRYINSFWIATTKFEKWIAKIQTKIQWFLKNNLHLDIKYNNVTTWNKTFILLINTKFSLKKIDQKNHSFTYYYKTYIHNFKGKLKIIRILIHKIKKNLTITFNLKALKRIKQLKKWHINHIINYLISKKNIILSKWNSFYKTYLNKKLLLFIKLYYKYSINFITVRNKLSNFISWRIKNKLILNLKAMNKILLKQHIKYLWKKNSYILIKIPFNRLIHYFNIRYLSIKKYKLQSIKLNIPVMTDYKIISYYLKISCNLIHYYRITDNFKKMKNFTLNIKWICYSILSKKYKKSITWIQKVYKENLKLNNGDKKILSFPSFNYIKSLRSRNIIFKKYTIFLQEYKFQNNLNNPVVKPHMDSNIP